MDCSAVIIKIVALGRRMYARLKVVPARAAWPGRSVLAALLIEHLRTPAGAANSTVGQSELIPGLGLGRGGTRREGGDPDQKKNGADFSAFPRVCQISLSGPLAFGVTTKIIISRNSVVFADPGDSISAAYRVDSIEVANSGRRGGALEYSINPNNYDPKAMKPRTSPLPQRWHS